MHMYIPLFFNMVNTISAIIVAYIVCCVICISLAVNVNSLWYLVGVQCLAISGVSYSKSEVSLVLCSTPLSLPVQYST